MSRRGNLHGHRHDGYPPNKRFRYEGQEYGGFMPQQSQESIGHSSGQRPPFQFGDAMYPQFRGFDGMDHRHDQMHREKGPSRPTHREVYEHQPPFNKPPMHPWSPSMPAVPNPPFPSPTRPIGNIRKPVHPGVPGPGPPIHDIGYKFPGQHQGGQHYPDRDFHQQGPSNPSQLQDYRLGPPCPNRPPGFNKDRQQIYRNPPRGGHLIGSPQEQGLSSRPPPSWSISNPPNVKGSAMQQPIKHEVLSSNLPGTSQVMTNQNPHRDTVAPSLKTEGELQPYRADPRLKAAENDVSKLLDSKESLLSMMDKVDKDIAYVEESITDTKKRVGVLNEELEHCKRDMTETEDDDESESSSKLLVEKASNSLLSASTSLAEKLGMDNDDLIKKIYDENRTKAAAAEARFTRLNFDERPAHIPLYNQPSDLLMYHKNICKHRIFRRKLINSLRKNKLRENALQTKQRHWFEKQRQIWQKRVDKLESNPRRKARMTRLRGLHEREFPEIKKQREQQERLNRFGSRSGWGAFARSEAELEEIVDNLSEIEATEKQMYLLAVDPPRLLDKLERRVKYINHNGLIRDVLQFEQQRTAASQWTSTEEQIFRTRFAQHPKNFTYIANGLERKAVSDCVLHYYQNKKKSNFKMALRKSAKRKKLQKQASSTPSVDQQQYSGKQRLKEKEVDVEDEYDDEDGDEMDADSVASGGIPDEPDDVSLPQPSSESTVASNSAEVPTTSAHLSSVICTAVVTSSSTVVDQSLSVEELIAKHLAKKSDHVDPSRWSESEMAKAVEGLKRFGRNWVAIATLVQTKSEAQCKNFYSNYKRKFHLESILGIAMDHGSLHVATQSKNVDGEALRGSRNVREHHDTIDYRKGDVASRRPSLRSYRHKDGQRQTNTETISLAVSVPSKPTDLPLGNEMTKLDYQPTSSPPMLPGVLRKSFPAVPPPPLTPVMSRGSSQREFAQPTRSQMEEISLQADIPAFKLALDASLLPRTVTNSPHSSQHVSSVPGSFGGSMSTSPSSHSFAGISDVPHSIHHQQHLLKRLQSPPHPSVLMPGQLHRRSPGAGHAADVARTPFVDLNMTIVDSSHHHPNWNRSNLGLRHAALSLSPRGLDHGFPPGSVNVRLPDDRQHLASLPNPLPSHLRSSAAMASRPRTMSEMYERVAIIPDVIHNRPSSAPDPLRVQVSHESYRREQLMQQHLSTSLASRGAHHSLGTVPHKHDYDLQMSSGPRNAMNVPTSDLVGRTSPRYGIGSGIAPRPPSLTSITGNVSFPPQSLRGTDGCGPLSHLRSPTSGIGAARLSPVPSGPMTSRSISPHVSEEKRSLTAMFRPWDDRPSAHVPLQFAHELSAAMKHSGVGGHLTGRSHSQPLDGTHFEQIPIHSSGVSNSASLSSIIPYETANDQHDPSQQDSPIRDFAQSSSQLNDPDHSDSATLSADEGYQYLSSDDEDFRHFRDSPVAYSASNIVDTSSSSTMIQRRTESSPVNISLLSSSDCYLPTAISHSIPVLHQSDARPMSVVVPDSQGISSSSNVAPTPQLDQWTPEERQTVSESCKGPVAPATSDIELGTGVSSSVNVSDENHSMEVDQVPAIDTTVNDNNEVELTSTNVDDSTIASSAGPLSPFETPDDASVVSSCNESELIRQEQPADSSAGVMSSTAKSPDASSQSASIDARGSAADQSHVSNSQSATYHCTVEQNQEQDQFDVGSSGVAATSPTLSPNHMQDSPMHSPPSVANVESSAMSSDAFPTRTDLKSDGELSDSSSLSSPTESGSCRTSCYDTVPISPPESPIANETQNDHDVGISLGSSLSLSLLRTQPTLNSRQAFPMTAFPYSSLSLNVGSQPGSRKESACASPSYDVESTTCVQTSSGDVPMDSTCTSSMECVTTSGAPTVPSLTVCSPSPEHEFSHFETENNDSNILTADTVSSLTYEPLSDAESDHIDNSEASQHDN